WAFISGFGFRLILEAIAVIRSMLVPKRLDDYAAHTHNQQLPVAAAIALSVLGVVMFGSLAGSMLPFVLRRLGLDPASASAPFVATLVDVTGLIIYFTVASLILHGTLL